MNKWLGLFAVICVMVLAGCGAPDGSVAVGTTATEGQAATAVVAPTATMASLPTSVFGEPTPVATVQPTTVSDVTAPAEATGTIDPGAALTALAQMMSTPQATPGALGTAEVLVRYSIEGGIAGLNDTLEIYEDGRVMLHARGTVTQPQIEVTNLVDIRGLLRTPDFLALDKSYGPLGECCDFRTYVIEVPGINKTVTTIDGAERPVMLELVLQQIDQVYDKARAAGETK